MITLFIFLALLQLDYCNSTDRPGHNPTCPRLTTNEFFDLQLSHFKASSFRYDPDRDEVVPVGGPIDFDKIVLKKGPKIPEIDTSGIVTSKDKKRDEKLAKETKTDTSKENKKDTKEQKTPKKDEKDEKSGEEKKDEKSRETDKDHNIKDENLKRKLDFKMRAEKVSFKKLLSQYGGLDGFMSEIVNNEQFQQIALLLKQYPFLRNVLKLLFDFGLGGMRSNGCSRCAQGTVGGDSFESRRFEKGKSNLKKEDFEGIFETLDRVKDTIEKDDTLLDFFSNFENDPLSSLQLLLDPSILKKLFGALDFGPLYGKNQFTGMERSFEDIISELDV